MSDWESGFSVLLPAEEKGDRTSYDGELFIEIDEETFREEVFIKIEEAAEEDPVVKTADEKAGEDPYVRKLSGYRTYEIEVLDSEKNPVRSLEKQVLLSIAYYDADDDGIVDGTDVRVDSLGIFYLNEDEGYWELVAMAADFMEGSGNIMHGVQKKGSGRYLARIKTDHFSKYRLMGVWPPKDLVSEVFNYPNPFAAGRESTMIRYYLAEDADVRIVIYTLIGNLVKSMQIDSGSAGGERYWNEVPWDGKNEEGETVANGGYVIRIEADNGNKKEYKMHKAGVLK